VVENLADTVHFHYVHGTPTVPQSVVDIDGHIFRLEMFSQSAEGVDEYRNFFHVEGVGLIWLYMPDFGVTVLTSVTPVEDSRIQLSLHIRRRIDQPIIGQDRFEELAEMLVASTALDIPIWEHRKYPEHPMLLPEDGSIQLMRRWVSSYYQPDSYVKQ
jgi:hypothetical protein